MESDLLADVVTTVETALREDIREGDITAELIDSEKTAGAEIITRDDAVLCGRPWVDEVFRQVDPGVSLQWQVSDGDDVVAHQVLVRLHGPARALLTAERTALNFLQTLSGTATRTRHYASLITHTRGRLLDTRKTLPGLRLAQKYAVRCGGGVNHRIGLFDAFLIKENHIMAAGSITRAIERARSLHPGRRVEVEVENLDEFRQAIDAGPDWIMLDNFSLKDLRAAVDNNGSGIALEASGGIESDDDIVRIAETGVDYISVGALTKHCVAVDLSMRLLQD